jgi:hypothetical protein
VRALPLGVEGRRKWKLLFAIIQIQISWNFLTWVALKETEI